MRSTKHSALLVAAAVAMSAGLPSAASARSSQPIRVRARRNLTKPKTVIEVWNEAVEARKAAKKARKANGGAQR